MTKHNCFAVIDFHNDPIFVGNYQECLSYMKSYSGWKDLMSAYKDNFTGLIELIRYASWKF